MSAFWIVSLLFGAVALANAQEDICASMRADQMFHWVPSPDVCNAFFMCYKLGPGDPISAWYPCPYGAFWDGEKCDYIRNVPCSIDTCLTGVSGYRDASHPRSYYACKDLRTDRQLCCPRSQLYDSNLDTCVSTSIDTTGDDIYCNDEGDEGEGAQTPQPCGKTVNAADPRRYSGPVNDMTYKFRCASGTFNEETCTCSGPEFNGPCEPILSVNFANGVVENDPNGITVHIQNDEAVVSPGRAVFNGLAGLSSQYFTGAYYGTKLRISVTFTEGATPSFAGEETLVSQSSIDGLERSIVISLNRQNNRVTFTLKADTMASTAVSFNGGQSQRKTATLEYDGATLVGRVTWPGGIDTTSVKLSGPALGTSDSLRFASGVNLPGFTGSIEDIELYQFCTPN